MRWKEARYGGTDVMERSCAVARGIDINKAHCTRISNGCLVDSKKIEIESSTVPHEN
jgi:hypothetical protein